MNNVYFDIETGFVYSRDLITDINATKVKDGVLSTDNDKMLIESNIIKQKGKNEIVNMYAECLMFTKNGFRLDGETFYSSKGHYTATSYKENEELLLKYTIDQFEFLHGKQIEDKNDKSKVKYFIHGFPIPKLIGEILDSRKFFTADQELNEMREMKKIIPLPEIPNLY